MNTEAFISEEEWSGVTEEKRQVIAAAISKDRDDLDFREIQLPNTFYVKYGKRLLDILLSGLACIVVFPFNLIIGIITFFDVGSPIFFRQVRVGRNGRFFSLIKFRNMTNETNEQGVLLPPEQRVTKWGKFVRKTSLDELLNFWSILKGDMSIIGPRPLPEKYAIRFSKYHQQRHLVRPGLECPFHECKLAKLGWQGRFENDIWYVEHLSFLTDVKMSCLLVKKVFSKAERGESANGETREFMGYKEDGTVMSAREIPRKYLELAKETSNE
ncbi:MAG: sugar transferase [Lachnospiraceae bacterium]|nr:sugar transferase [Lachnospiraceae bacterium]